MAENSEISWTHHTFNPWRGCTKVSACCANCYAETFSGRNPKTLGVWGPGGTRVVAAEAQWRAVLKWDREAAARYSNWRYAVMSATSEYDAVDPYVRPRVFCASLADVFEGGETMPAGSRDAVRDARARLFALVAACQNLDWLLLTKRPANVNSMVRKASGGVEPDQWFRDNPNVWVGTSVENQAAADERIPHLLQVPARVRFLSMEPLLGPVELSNVSRRADAVEQLGKPALSGIHWVIVGGESGPAARPMHPDWARSLRDQCRAVGVPFHFKQWGEYAPDSAGGMFSVGDKANHTIDELGRLDVPHGGGQLTSLRRVGKKKAGRLLDGREWDEFPDA